MCGVHLPHKIRKVDILTRLETYYQRQELDYINELGQSSFSDLINLTTGYEDTV